MSTVQAFTDWHEAIPNYVYLNTLLDRVKQTYSTEHLLMGWKDSKNFSTVFRVPPEAGGFHREADFITPERLYLEKHKRCSFLGMTEPALQGTGPDLRTGIKDLRYSTWVQVLEAFRRGPPCEQALVLACLDDASTDAIQAPMRLVLACLDASIGACVLG